MPQNDPCPPWNGWDLWARGHLWPQSDLILKSLVWWAEKRLLVVPMCFGPDVEFKEGLILCDLAITLALAGSACRGH